MNQLIVKQGSSAKGGSPAVAAPPASAATPFWGGFSGFGPGPGSSVTPPSAVWSSWSPFLRQCSAGDGADPFELLHMQASDAGNEKTDDEWEGAEKEDRSWMLVRLQGDLGGIQLPPEIWISLAHHDTVGVLYKTVERALRARIPAQWFNRGWAPPRLADPSVKVRGPVEFVRKVPKQ